MAMLDGALVLTIVLAGAATLSPHHLLLLAAGLVAGVIALLVTYGHVVVRSRRPSRVPTSAGGSLDVEPAEPLAVAPMDGRTAAAVILGAAGIFLFNPVFGAIAIGLGGSALRRGTPGRWGRPGAVAGIVLGVADYVVLCFVIAGRVSSHGFHYS